AAALAEAGAHVVLAARSLDDLEQAAAAINEAGGSAEAVQLDVSDTQTAMAVVTAAMEAGGPFNILFNNAGINRPGPMTDMSEDDFDAVMDVNVKAAFFVAKAVARAMIDGGNGGTIIHTSSQMGHVGGIDRTVYASSKHAIEGLSKAMAVELAPHNIRVNTICPTFIRTPLTASTLADPERVKWIKSKIKLGRLGEVEDIMGAVLYLASDASSLVTGSALLIDGGWTAG
ncbi:MAG: SDR family oxidoreductase, partial [Rhodospirillales bacterium]|nr:SDR family oxidoreductase [Rhodospirillales bacterium]